MAPFALTLPDGLGFTSQSGVFLSLPQDGPSSISEPTLLLMLGGAVIAFGFTRWSAKAVSSA
jgi:hypothetical protein